MYKIINIELNTKVNMYPELSKEHARIHNFILFYFFEILIVLFGKKKPKNSLKNISRGNIFLP